MGARPRNRRGKSRSFSGSTLRLFQRIEAGLGKSYIEADRLNKMRRSSLFRKVRRDAIHG